jgi:hypothetical protein
MFESALPSLVRKSASLRGCPLLLRKLNLANHSTSATQLAAFPTKLVLYAVGSTTFAVKRKIQEITIEQFALGSKETLKKKCVSRADGIGSTVAVQRDPEVHVLQKAVVHLGTWIQL